MFSCASPVYVSPWNVPKDIRTESRMLEINGKARVANWLMFCVSSGRFLCLFPRDNSLSLLVLSVISVTHHEIKKKGPFREFLI